MREQQSRFPMITFLTPYWCGAEMMRIHLASIRRFYPEAAILVSKRDGGKEEMAEYAREFGVRYWLEECSYVEALLRLFGRTATQYVCVADHDVALLSNIDVLIQGLSDGRWDLVGVEERIRDPYGRDWMRSTPGYVDSNFLIFNMREFVRQWGIRGVKWKTRWGSANREFHYGICEKLTEHKYLMPYHTAKYGFGNLLCDGGLPLAWHQWYGSYRRRPLTASDLGMPIEQGLPALTQAERAFLEDYPNLDLTSLRPAWGPGIELTLQNFAYQQRWQRVIAVLRRLAAPRRREL